MKKLLLFIFVAIFVISLCGCGDSSTKSDDKLDFVVSDVRNDSSGNWKISTVAENIKVQDIALDYYEEKFKSDKEIHAIVNFNNKTTSKISVVGDLLEVTVHEYVKGEEHDANLLYSGLVLEQYHVNIKSGEIGKI